MFPAALMVRDVLKVFTSGEGHFILFFYRERNVQKLRQRCFVILSYINGHKIVFMLLLKGGFAGNSIFIT